MSILVVWASPNVDGLTASCKDAAVEGIELAGKDVKDIQLNAFDIERCNVCGRGFGTCNEEGHLCCKNDDFEKIQKLHLEAEAIVVITPVYWQEMSEPAKAFYDRLRRCEAKSGNLKDKKCIVVAAAGGSGNGAVACLEQMERTMKNVGMEVLDRLPIIRYSREYMLEAIKCSVQKMCEQL